MKTIKRKFGSAFFLDEELISRNVKMKEKQY